MADSEEIPDTLLWARGRSRSIRMAALQGVVVVVAGEVKEGAGSRVSC